MFLNIIYDKNHLNTFITSRGGASRILLLWSNIPALAAGKRAFRQLRLVCAYCNSGILPGEEMMRANKTNKCNQHKYPPERQYRRPTDYTPCEYVFGVGAMPPASPRDALTEQSAHGSLVRAQTRSCLIM